MKRFLKKYPVVLSLTLICLLFAAITCFYNGMYDLFAFHSRPVYFWQYFSGTFMHGSKGAPLWFLWVHFFMNCLMLIPFGHILEGNAGSKHAFIVFAAAVRVFYLILIALSLIMLLPVITGWVSTCLHLSGIASYFLVRFAGRLRRR